MLLFLASGQLIQWESQFLMFLFLNFSAVFAVGSQNSNLKVLYSHSKQQSSVSKSIRHIPQTPERILDAPDILDDYCEWLYDLLCDNYSSFYSE